MRSVTVLAVALAAAILPAVVGCQTSPPPQKPVSLDLTGNAPLDPAALEQFRAEFRANKREFTAKAMHLDAAQDKIFWPIYDKYSAEMTIIGDESVSIITDYRAKSATFTPAEADALSRRFIDNNHKAQALIESYYAKVTQALDATVGARFLQAENRMLTTTNLNLSAMLPLIK